MNKDIAVFGLGIFGSKLAKELQKQGNTVLAVDVNSDHIKNIKDYVSQAIIADVTDKDVITELGVQKFDAAVICMSDSLENQILCLTHLKNQGVKKVIAKVNTEIQKEILIKLGADEVIQPEEEAAIRLARLVSVPNIIDMYKLKDAHIASAKPTKEMCGSTLKEIGLLQKFNISAVLIKRSEDEEAQLAWNPNIVISEDDEITVIGAKKDIENAFRE